MARIARWGGGLILPVLALLGLAQNAAAAVPPRLSFSDAEMALAQDVARSPALAAFYGGNGLRPVFAGPEGEARRRALIAAVGTARAHGLPAWRYRIDRLRALDAAGGTDPATEGEMARAFAAWVHDVSAGMLDPRRVAPSIKREGAGADVAALLADFAIAADPAAVLASAEPQAPQYRALKAALANAQGLVAPEGTPPAPPGNWKAGMRDPALADLRARLAAMGFDPGPAADPAVYDAALAGAVAAFQKAVGLPADGAAGPRTVTRLNRPAGEGPRDVLMAMERWRWLPDDLAEGQDRYIWVNLPSFVARIEDAAGATTFETKVVVGKPDPEMQTPEFSDRMEFVVANPRWNVPRSITVKEYLPRLKKNPGAAAQLDIVDRAGRVVPRDRIDFGRYTEANFPYRMRQKPSEDNALGQVKFLFPNPWNIYLHDTPSKGLFGEARRAFSHGCVRVGRPVDLARALLSAQSADPAATFAAALKGGQERYLTLKPSVPVHLVYFTLMPDADGAMHRYGDVYGRDAALWAAMSRAMTPPQEPELAAN